MKNGWNEARTRVERIDRQLARAGWRLEGTDFEAEYEVGSVGDPDHGFSDYMLPAADGLPLAIVEAKRSSRDAIAGKEQARNYAKVIEERTGRLPMIFLANGDEVWYWDLAGNPRRVGGFFRRQDLERRFFQAAYRVPLATVPIDSSIVERPYQHEAIRRAHDALGEDKRRMLWIMATGTGKTRTVAALIDTLIRSRVAQQVLFLVDRNALATQALEAFGDHLPSEPSDLIRAATYDGTKRLYVATLQTMQDFHEEFSAGAFDLVVSDECHRSIYNKWESVFSYFDAYLLGLTATPADYIDRNTFTFFGCEERTPTFAYELEQAVEDGYLVPYAAYHARTTIQIEGIHGAELPPEVQEQLVEEGVDPEDVDFAGTDLERKVTNRETIRLLAREFFENAIPEPGANLPGKSIIFAMSHSHARRLWKVFSDEYPQFPGLAEIIDSHMERPEDMLRRFKTESLPRIAISVDMLDTGVDIPTVVNLGFMKPVFSRIKFWQMMGRGTRRVDDEAAAKPWCPAGSKSAFRVLDFWGNLRRFQIEPEGAEPSRNSTPVAVRYFRTLLRAARATEVGARPDLRDGLLAEARQMVEDLPIESAGVREYRSLVHDVYQEMFWSRVNSDRYRLLSLEVAPLMRYLSGVDLPALMFSTRCLDHTAAELSGDREKALRAAAAVRDDVMRLPSDYPQLSPVIGRLRAVHDVGWGEQATLEEVLELRATLAQFMRLKQPEPSHIITLDLADAFKEQQWIAVGPEAKEFDADAYRERVEREVRRLAETHPAVIKLRAGDRLTEGDITAIEEALSAPDLYITEETLRAAYHAPHGTLLGLLRHALGAEPLESREDAVREAFEAFITEKGYLSAEQLTFVRLFARRLIHAGRVRPADLYGESFARLGTAPEGRIPAEDVNALFDLASRFEIA